MDAPTSAQTIKGAITTIIAFGTALFGWMGWLLVVWLLCLVLDYATGSWAAISRGEWSSAKAREGLWHKLGEIMAVLVAALCDIALSVLARGGGFEIPSAVAVTPIVAMWYVFTELGSIIENCALLGAPIPKWLTGILAKLKNAADTKGESAAAGSGNSETEK